MDQQENSLIIPDKSILYYLSHPYTSIGNTDDNYLSSLEIHDSLKRQGYAILNPLEYVPRLTKDENVAMKYCKLMLSVCDAIILCNCWHKSKGCIQEAHWAVEDNKPVFYYSPDKKLKTSKEFGFSLYLFPEAY